MIQMHFGFLIALLFVVVVVTIFFSLRWAYESIKANPAKFQELREDWLEFKLKAAAEQASAKVQFEAYAREAEEWGAATAKRIRERASSLR